MSADTKASLDVLELRNAHIHLRSASSVFNKQGGFSESGEGAADFPVLECVTEHCYAVIALQGAQLLSFRPTGKSEVLWLSPLAKFSLGDAVRGGIPICLPWFGVNRHQADLPKHGIARTQLWTLGDVQQADDGIIRLCFTFRSSDNDLALYPYPVSAELTVELGEELGMSLQVANEGDEPMPLSFALHSYFSVSDVQQVSIAGIDGRDYLDNCQDLSRCVQSEPLTFNGEIDRVYEAVGGRQVIHDDERDVYIDGEGCDTVVVWNPGAVLAGKMADVGPHYQRYVCVERGMAFGDELMLAAGSEATANMRLSTD
ncbi:Putative glucose-6-phosphate 1-epimerase [Zhongshania aliphaticivorans]|uniref:Putative glucose-6-phosphate 1-epimerase n=1 Tax=Zhongshania aliphaticivorans TaxID=1470434 RepID=A0A5S9PWZ6_9GAMM|nr:D-hexose-6-phosphate mutarotase [Zhongshania aliphaticivorans]CAA0109593.1 Putative glucose-6-phosphate 1-epimerase [Zhongshania aliphaticivorans]CAA0117769.1 Putative glucose-6-phosphate 1-epimerase [Zhongshania aliphaticivorans]CAA0121516.1 Putative glucose-6-phosphate 1-epimerase [Zhongshania aliphaticivorans]